MLSWHTWTYLKSPKPTPRGEEEPLTWFLDFGEEEPLTWFLDSFLAREGTILGFKFHKDVMQKLCCVQCHSQVVPSSACVHH